MSKITRVLSVAFVATTAIAVMSGGVAGAAPAPRNLNHVAVYHRMQNADASFNGSILAKSDPNKLGYYPEVDVTANNLDAGSYKVGIDTVWTFTFMGVSSQVHVHYNTCSFTTRDNGKTVGCRLLRTNMTGTLVDSTITDASGRLHASANF